ncbi:MAG: radical SAM/SPASM domain-containing protein [bacterium]
MLKKILRALNLIKESKFDLLFYKILTKFGFKNILPPLPKWLIIEPISLCNLRCSTCPTGLGKTKRLKPSMTFDEFKKIIDEVRGYVGKVVLFNYGEPFLNKELLKMIKYAVEADIRVKVSTNGHFFNDEKFCEEVVKSGLQHLIIALDGTDQETVEKTRPGANFSSIVQGFQNIRDAKRKLNSRLPKLELQFIIMRHNESQKEKMKEFAKEWGVDVYTEKAVGLYNNDPEFNKVAEELLPNNLSSSRYYKNSAGNYELKGNMSNHCNIVMGATVINSDGNVVPCCYDEDCEHVMGNVFATSLKSIWQGKKYNNFRDAIKKNRKAISICNTCSEGRYEGVVNKQKLD